MKYLTNSLNSYSLRLAGGLILGAVVLTTALALFSQTRAPSRAAADENCPQENCQNDSADFAVNTTAEDVTLDLSSPDDGGTVTAGDTITLQWTSEGANDLTASNNYSNASWQGGKTPGANQSESFSLPARQNPYNLNLEATNTNNGNTQTETVTITVNALPADINNFQVNDINDEPNIIYTDENFGLSWDTANASGGVSGSSDPGSSFSGSKNADRGAPGEIISESTPGDYEYTLTARDSLNNPTRQTLTVTVEELPATYRLSAAPATVDIDGVPGSTADTAVEISDTQNFPGTVDLSATNIPTRDGKDLFSVSFSDDSLSGAGDSTAVEVTTNEVIRTDQTYTIRVQGTDTPDDNSDFVDIQINADGFSPRTIEEF